MEKDDRIIHALVNDPNFPYMMLAANLAYLTDLGKKKIDIDKLAKLLEKPGKKIKGEK